RDGSGHRAASMYGLAELVGLRGVTGRADFETCVIAGLKSNWALPRHRRRLRGCWLFLRQNRVGKRAQTGKQGPPGNSQPAAASWGRPLALAQIQHEPAQEPSSSAGEIRPVSVWANELASACCSSQVSSLSAS